MNLKRTFLTTLSDWWWWFSQAAGILIIAGGISILVLMAFSTPGQVMIVTRGPRILTPSVAYKGELSYRISTSRKASCPGMVVISLSSIDDEDPLTVTFTRPVRSVEIKPTDDATVVVALPPSVTPGKWRYRAILDSQCPTFNRQDMIADFLFDVTAKEARREGMNWLRSGPIWGDL